MSKAILYFNQRNQSMVMRDDAYELTPARDARFDADCTVRVVGKTGFHNQVDSCFPSIFFSKFRGVSLALIGYNLAAIVVIELCYISEYVNSRQSSTSLADRMDGESARRCAQRDSKLRSRSSSSWPQTWCAGCPLSPSPFTCSQAAMTGPTTSSSSAYSASPTRCYYRPTTAKPVHLRQLQEGAG